MHAYAPYSRFAVGAALRPEGSARARRGGERRERLVRHDLVRRAQRRLHGRHRRAIAGSTSSRSTPTPKPPRRAAPAGRCWPSSRPRSRWSTGAAARSWPRRSTSCCPSASSCERARASLGPGGAGRAAERGQVDAREPARGRARRRRLGPAADHAAARDRRRPPARPAARPGRPAGVPEALRPPDGAHAAVGQRDARRRRRDACSCSMPARRSAPAIATSPRGCSPRGRRPCVVAVNKTDHLGADRIVPALAEAAALGSPHAVHPISALAGDGVDALLADLLDAAARGAGVVPARHDHRSVARAPRRRARARARARAHPRRGAARRRRARRVDHGRPRRGRWSRPGSSARPSRRRRS